MIEYFAGLDVSTQGSKMIVVDLATSKILFTDFINYDRDLPRYQTKNGTRQNAGLGVSESDPRMWIEATNLLFERLSSKRKFIPYIKAISVSGQQHGLVTITKDGTLSRPYSKLWNDFSTGEECEILTKKLGGVNTMIKLIGNTQRTGYTAPKIFHMVRNEPQNWKKTETVFLVHNYINWVLTGGIKSGIAKMEPGDVSGSALWDPVHRSWSKKVIEAISPDLMEKLPPVASSREMIGPIGKEFVEKFNFSADCQIASGSGDNMMGAIGTGNYREGIVTVSLGTSGTAYSYMTKPYVDPEGEIASFCDATGNYLPLLCISNLANGYEAILKQYNLTHEQFIDVIGKTPPGNNGRMLCPWYEGERTPDLPEAAPIYFGWGLGDFSQEYLCRAVMEGHIMNLYEGFLKLPIKAKEIRITGGISKSQAWRQTIADIFECDVVAVLGEGAAMGAALHAAWSYYKSKSLPEIADSFVVLDQANRVKPNSENIMIYRKFKAQYLAVSQRIRGKTGDNPFKIHKSLV